MGISYMTPPQACEHQDVDEEVWALVKIKAVIKADSRIKELEEACKYFSIEVSRLNSELLMADEERE